MNIEKKNTKMTVSELEAIDKLMSRGFDAKEIHDVLKRSTSGIHNYMRLLKFVKNGQSFSMNPTRFCSNVLDEYAEKNGYKKPVNTYSQEIKRIAFGRKQIEGVVKGQISIDELSATTPIANLVRDIADKLRELSFMLNEL